LFTASTPPKRTLRFFWLRKQDFRAACGVTLAALSGKAGSGWNHFRRALETVRHFSPSDPWKFFCRLNMPLR
jgi:hypothetical protein